VEWHNSICLVIVSPEFKPQYHQKKKKKKKVQVSSLLSLYLPKCGTKFTKAIDVLTMLSTIETRVKH
jgi:hypothetical protein